MRRSTVSAKITRDEFSPRTKQILAERAALRCSNPECRVLTKGPTLSREGVQNAGCAAHITAAASGGPRFDPSLTSKERKVPSNGIWLCRNCGERVDDDEPRYSTPMLRKWKADIELEVERALGHPAPLKPEAHAELSWVVGEEVVDPLVLEFHAAESSYDEALRRKFDAEEIDELAPDLQERCREFNDTVDRYCKEVGDRREVESAWLREEDDAVEITLELYNPGTEPLRNARVFATLPDGFSLANDDKPVQNPRIPDPPARPKDIDNRLNPGLDKVMTMMARIERSTALPVGLGSFDKFNLSSANFLPSVQVPVVASQYWGLDIDGNTIEGFRRSLTHNLRHVFDEQVRIIPPEQPGTYTASYTIHADNLPVPVNGKLTLEVVEAQEEPPSPEVDEGSSKTRSPSDDVS